MTDPAELTRIRNRAALAYASPAAAAASAADVPRLLAVLDAVRDLHKPGRVRKSYDLDLRCEPHDWTEHAVRDFDAVQACPDCSFREYSRCVHGCEGDWPCATSRAITRALLAEEAGDGAAE